MPDFVTAVVDTDATTLLDTGLDSVNVNLTAAGLPNWSPSDATLAVIILGIVAQWAADDAGIAAVVLPAIFRAFGTQLCNIPYSGGAFATVDSTWTFTAPAPGGGYQIDTSRAVLIDGQTFYVQTEVDVAPGATSATVALVANESGTAYNDLGGVSQPLQLNDQIDWVASVVSIGVTSGGADQETDPEYQNKLANLLTLQRISIVNAADYPPALMSDICEQVTGVAVGRATALDGYYPNSLTCTASFSSAATAVTIGTGPFVGAVPYPGATVTGTGIASSTTVAASPAPTSTSFSLSANSTAAESGVTLTIGAWSNIARTVTSFVTDINGVALSGGSMTTLSNWLATYREVNFLPFVLAPSYNTIYVSVSVHPLPGMDASAAAASVQLAMLSYLSPASWGNPGAASTGSNQWLNSGDGFNVVRLNKLIGIAESIPTIDYVPPGGLTLGFTASPVGTADITMSGPAPLPTSTTSTIVVTTV